MSSRLAGFFFGLTRREKTAAMIFLVAMLLGSFIPGRIIVALSDSLDHRPGCGDGGEGSEGGLVDEGSALHRWLPDLYGRMDEIGEGALQAHGDDGPLWAGAWRYLKANRRSRPSSGSCPPVRGWVCRARRWRGQSGAPRRCATPAPPR